jgi:hypothetical protein
MATTPLLGLELPVTGTLSGTWGDTVNTSITSLLDTAVAGTTTLSTDADVTLTATASVANQARSAILLCTGARTVLRTITAPASSKTYVVNNATTGGFGVKLVGVGPTTGITINNGETAVVAWNGTDFVRISTLGGPITGTTGTFSGAVSGTTGTFTGDVQLPSANGGQLAGLRNKIINGSFIVNQRGITTVTPVSGDYTLDRWQAVQTTAGKFSVATGAANAAAVAAGVSGALTTITSLSPYTVGASEIFNFQQRIEGYNIADLLWGSASAKTVTLSFYVTSTLTGTFGGALRNSANTRSYPFSYSIPAANTWTRISVTITGDTGGAFADWLTTTGTGVIVIFSLGAGGIVSGTAGAWAAANYSSATGAVSVVATNAATWTVANVQLEVGPVATPFEQIPIGLSLSLCQRYLPSVSTTGAGILGHGGTTSTSFAGIQLPLPVTPRVAPTGITLTSAIGNYGLQTATVSSSATAISLVNSSLTYCRVQVTGTGTPYTISQPADLYTGAVTAAILMTGCEL